LEETMSDIKVNSGGCSLGMVLFLIFLVLKLTGVIAWSWWWVTCPLWGGIALILSILFGALIVGAIIVGIRALLNK
jgi:hypothetical protein